MANENVIDPVELIYRDGMSCMLQNNSQDTRFWTQTVKDGYYDCTDYACGTINTWQDDSSPSDVDWTAPIEDDDPYDPFCVKEFNSSDSYVDSTGASVDYDTMVATYQCTKIKCVVERKFDTGYTDDFRIQAVNDLVSPTTDVLTIPLDTVATMRLGLLDIDASTNEPDTSTGSYFTQDAEVTITIASGAISNLSLAATATAFMLANLAF